MYLLNRFFPLFADDWNYSFIFGSEEWIRISTVRDIIESQYNHYIIWGGRVVVHFIAQVLLLLDPLWHDIINTLIFVAFIYVIYRISNYSFQANPLVFILIFLFIWFFQPAFGATLLWITGSANYLWGTLIILLFIYPYYSFYRNTELKLDSCFFCACLFMAGIITGWTNENMSLGVIIFVVLLCILLKKESRIPRWAISGLIGACIGCILLLGAPGNYVRLEGASEMLKEHQTPFFEVLTNRLSLMSSHYLHYILPLIIIYALLFYLIKRLWNNPQKKKVLLSSFIFFITSHIAFFVMIASPQFPIRALFGVITFLIIAITILYANLGFNKKLKVLSSLAVFLLLFPFAYDYNQRYDVLEYASSAWQKRNEYVLQERSKGNLNIIIKDKIYITHPKYHLYEMPSDSREWQNRAYSHFYGVDSIRVIQ